MTLKYENVGALFLLFERLIALSFGNKRDKLAGCGGLKGWGLLGIVGV